MITQHVARWNPATPGKEWRNRGRLTTRVGSDDPTVSDPVAASLFAGHTPGRVLVGMAAPESGPRPQRLEAMTIINQPVYESRRFVGSSISLSGLNSMLFDADTINDAFTGASGAYPFVSFKEAFGAASTGALDASLNIIRDKAIARRTSGPGGAPQPFMCSFNHEPVGDGDLNVWAQDHIYASNYLASVNDICAWSCIPNGNRWGPKNYSAIDCNAMVPQALIDTFMANKSAICPDFYDPNPPNNDRNAPGGYNADADRTHRKVQAFLDWYRARGGTGAVGCGEFSCVDAAGMQATMDVMFANRDIWAISNYFNSMANSRWEWRLIMDAYPAYNPPTSKGFVDEGGNVQTELRLFLFRDFLNQSVSAAFTGPLP